MPFMESRVKLRESFSGTMTCMSPDWRPGPEAEAGGGGRLQSRPVFHVRVVEVVELSPNVAGRFSSGEQ